MEGRFLRIGNYVDDESTTHVVVGVDKNYIKSYWNEDDEKEILYKTPVKHVKPIIINSQWLSDFGFKTKNSKVGWYKKEGFRFTSRLTLSGLDIQSISKGSFIGICDCKYVHELQNAYFCLTGSELTIQS